VPPAASADAASPDAASAAALAPPRGKVVALVYTSNVGGALERCACTIAPSGGLARRAAEVDRIRAESDGVLQVDAGDLFLPRAAAASRPPSRGDVARRARLFADVYARLGVDAFTPGARDLALGVPLLRRVLADAKVPVVAANLVDARGAPVFAADRLVDVAGVAIGVFGVAGPAGRGAGFELRDPVAAANAEAAALRARGARLVVALVNAAAGEARSLLAQTRGVDWAVVGGAGRKLDVPELVEGSGARALEAFEEGHDLGRLDLHIVAGDGAGAYDDADARPRADAILASHRHQLAELERAPAARRDVTRLAHVRSAIARDEADLRAEPATLAGNWFRNRIVELDPYVPDQVGVAALVTAYDAEVRRAPPPDATPLAPTYLGTAACAKCHAPETASWRATKHARAFAALEGARRAKALDCIACHMTGFARHGGSIDPAVAATRLRDVGCEACHGPGSAHLDAPRDPSAITRLPSVAACLGCHTPDRTVGPFDAAARFAAIVGAGHGR